MRKKILLVLTSLILLIYIYIYNNTPKTNIIYLPPQHENLLENLPPKKQENEEILEIIKEINERNKHFRTFHVENMPIKVKSNLIVLSLTSELAFEKEKNFRLKIINRLRNLQMDIGSNKDIFWYWSKYDVDLAVHYAKHEDANKTMLRSALNPNWMIESLNLSSIETNNVKFNKLNSLYWLNEERKGLNGEKVLMSIAIDSENKEIVGRYLYNDKNKLIASTEYENFKNHLPESIHIIWHEENIFLEWDLRNAKINENLKSDLWVMPKSDSRINMAK